MKKILTLLSSLLVFAGIKAQTAPIVKKETVKPIVTKQPVSPADSIKAIKEGANTQFKQSTKVIKFDHIKKNTPVQMKENPAVTKPHKD